MTTRLASSLSKWSGFALPDVEHIIATAPRRYKVFTIPKKRGGLRQIAQPSRELKSLQVLLIGRVLHHLPVHDAAHGYVIGRGIKTNAQAHSKSNYLLKMDLRDFFPSIRPRDLRAHLKVQAEGYLTDEEVGQLCNLVFWRPKGQRGLRLCIGAPSSPFLSNTIMLGVDQKLAEVARSLGVLYTRYADDLAFSSNEADVLPALEARVIDVVEGSRFPKIFVNREKTVHISRAQRRMLTGLILNSVGDVSLGRDRKRLIRAMVQSSRYGRLDEKELEKLNGLLSFAHDVEPGFAMKMRARMALPQVDDGLGEV
ncbi:RNA-directed DNA polymerase [Lysobacteraceae bacterium NML93-0792]|nr:RNA-directed DNA polymerase [Xanthomonadaceae bacterium NML93-0792]PBS17375.1 RNA-directed DNA polymerase [Xanthomonadaceae bacterium NML93-0793]PBS20574.1 RNA-directed DNA polymerase [Xanthomonadaceae bacterium NML93-0831]